MCIIVRLVLTVLCALDVAVRASENACDSNPCHNGGRCYTYNWSSRYYHCICEKGYFGKKCDKVSPCVNESPCRNGGSCRSLSYYPGFSCICPTTHTGQQCEKENVCIVESNLCQNGGKCYPSTWRVQGYYCRCQSGYGGDNCQLKSLCGQNPCLNGGTCQNYFLDERRSYRCKCADGYKGDHCEHENPCKSDPCQNGGTCYSHFNDGPIQSYDYYCSCPDMYHGERCQLASECQTKVCYNGGSCYTGPDGSARCRCVDTYRGSTCQRRYCPVQLDTCHKYYWQFSNFDNCTATLRNTYAKRQQCAKTRYEEVKRLGSCDCMPEDVSESIRFMHMDVTAEEEDSCSRLTRDEDFDSCSEDARKCIGLFTMVFRGPSRGCNETEKEEMKSCFERYEHGTLNMRACPAGKAIFRMTSQYKFYLPIICTECRHWELGQNCSQFHRGPSQMDYFCSMYENGKEIIKCLLNEAEQSPQCAPVLGELKLMFRGVLDYIKDKARVACEETTKYKKAWSEDWGCKADSKNTIKRSVGDLRSPMLFI